jgi:hypothetical protein
VTSYKTFLTTTLSARRLRLEAIEYEACLSRDFCTALISYENNFSSFPALSVEDPVTPHQSKSYIFPVFFMRPAMNLSLELFTPF